MHVIVQKHIPKFSGKKYMIDKVFFNTVAKLKAEISYWDI